MMKNDEKIIKRFYINDFGDFRGDYYTYPQYRGKAANILLAAQIKQIEEIIEGYLNDLEYYHRVLQIDVSTINNYYSFYDDDILKYKEAIEDAEFIKMRIQDIEEDVYILIDKLDEVREKVKKLELFGLHKEVNNLMDWIGNSYPFIIPVELH